jgi:hypothetical protein
MDEITSSMKEARLVTSLLDAVRDLIFVFVFIFIFYLIDR